jgi:hypothetical protein
MRQYRPDVESQKLPYSRMMSRALLRRGQGKPPGGVACLADAMGISDRINENLEQWRSPSAAARLIQEMASK